MPRRKKYPGVAYKTNELFDPAPAESIRPQHSSGGAGFDRARVSYASTTLQPNLSINKKNSPARYITIVLIRQ